MEVIFLAFKDYFKFKDSNNQIYVVRNLGEDSKELFTNILNESSINYGLQNKVKKH